jgi:Fe-S cluster biogenesis protein NfuA
MSEKQENQSKPASKNGKTTRKPRKKKGVGDVVEDVLNSAPVKPVTEAVKKLIWKDGEDCGCEERKEKLNNIFKRVKKPRCLTESDYIAMKQILPKINSYVDYGDMERIARAHASVFNYHFSGTCSSCVSRNRGIINDMKTILKEYEND